jgi:hypothetical protein
MRYVRWVGLWAALLGSAPVLAMGVLADVTVVDCETGATLPMHYFHGEYWIAGAPGVRYAIHIRNRAAGRLLAVTSVDGVNVVTGETAGWGQSGYVFFPGQQYSITGWRKSDAEVAAFTFTALPDSYAALTGRPANIGVIGVALFRERASEPPNAPLLDNGSSRHGRERAENAPRARAAPPSPAGASAGSSLEEADPELGTGHGEREYSYVEHTEFQRVQDQPNEIVRIRYDSLERLVAMGIIRRAHPMPVGADPFPASMSRYVPDPPG